MTSTLSKLANEEQLYKVLSHIFPHENIQQNVMKSLSIKYPSTGKYMEFDVWIPKHDICFELQDSYHYITTSYYHATQSHIKKRDEIKSEMAKLNGLSFVTVPCWWNGESEQLLGTILFHRPELKSISYKQIYDPIPHNPPSDLFQSSLIPGVGELMLASFPQSKFDVEILKDSWWIGEKYDGIRLCWNASQANAYSRYGKDLMLLPSFLQQLPRIFVDSELWFGRGQFSHTYLLVNKNVDSNWPELRMLSFDVPAYESQKHKYELRYSNLIHNILHDHPFNIVVARRLLAKNKTHTHTALGGLVQAVLDDGGEGVILQRVASLYAQGRSSSLVKLKSVQADQEGIVVGITEKSVILKLADSTKIEVGAENVLIPIPKIGDVVTFSFENNSRREEPTNPKIYRLRLDIGWDEMVQSSFDSKNFLNSSSQVKGFTSKPVGHWSKSNMRAYMENFAESNNMDPIKADTWYNSLQSFLKSKSGKTILKKFKHGYARGLQQLFPDINFDLSLFQHTSYFKVENRRKFFEDYAKKHEFDPLVPDNWYSQPHDKIISVKGARRVIFYHNKSVPQALADLFPNIGFEKAKFKILRYDFYDDVNNRRLFFEDYARKHGFDSSKAESWIAQKDKILSNTEALAIIKYHNNNLTQTLTNLFPTINLDNTTHTRHNYWASSANRRNFFENYAVANKFDPLVASHWHKQSIPSIMAVRGSHAAISYHQSSVSKALVDLFPNIGLDRNRFVFRQNDWANKETRLQFFETYASNHGFDPLQPENWYAQSLNRLMSQKGIREVLFYYDYSVAKALRELYPQIGFDDSRLKGVFPHKQMRKATSK